MNINQNLRDLFGRENFSGFSGQSQNESFLQAMEEEFSFLLSQGEEMAQSNNQILGFDSEGQSTTDTFEVDVAFLQAQMSLIKEVQFSKARFKEMEDMENEQERWEKLLEYVDTAIEEDRDAERDKTKYQLDESQLTPELFASLQEEYDFETMLESTNSEEKASFLSHLEQLGVLQRESKQHKSPGDIPLGKLWEIMDLKKIEEAPDPDDLTTEEEDMVVVNQREALFRHYQLMDGILGDTSGHVVADASSVMEKTASNEVHVGIMETSTSEQSEEETVDARAEMQAILDGSYNRKKMEELREDEEEELFYELLQAVDQVVGTENSLSEEQWDELAKGSSRRPAVAVTFGRDDVNHSNIMQNLED